MPQHEYRCRGCGWEGTRIVNTDERDEQRCFRNLGTDEELTEFLHGERPEEGDPRCLESLDRVEISLTSCHAVAQEYGALVGGKGEATENLRPVSGKFGETTPKKGPRRALK
jgi:hypothetical protein